MQILPVNDIQQIATINTPQKRKKDDDGNPPIKTRKKRNTNVRKTVNKINTRSTDASNIASGSGLRNDIDTAMDTI
jgi:hypothetical protein